MDDTREIVNAAQVGTLLAVLSGAALVITGGLAAAARSRRSAVLTRGALLAGAAVLLFPAWMVYNAIEDHFGLDSVAALLINLGLFVALGGGIGLLFRRFWPAEATTHHGDTGTQSSGERVKG
jgi:hypothetical protein